MPPTTCTGKCFMPSTRHAASRQVANASGRISSRLSPAARRACKAGVMARSSPSVLAENSLSSASTLSAMGFIFFSSLEENVPNIFSKRDMSRTSYVSSESGGTPLPAGENGVSRGGYHIILLLKGKACQ